MMHTHHQKANLMVTQKQASHCQEHAYSWVVRYKHLAHMPGRDQDAINGNVHPLAKRNYEASSLSTEYIIKSGQQIIASDN